jgi:hypothetical protein
MRTLALIIVSFSIFVSCGRKDEIPSGIIAQDKMQAILWDMMRADQFLADYVLNRDSSKKKETESLKYYAKIFALHQVSKEDFEESFSFYRARPALMKTMMDSIAAPPQTATVQQPEPVTPVAIPDSVVQPAKPVITDTTPLRPRVDSAGRKRIKPVLQY